MRFLNEDLTVKRGSAVRIRPNYFIFHFPLPSYLSSPLCFSFLSYKFVQRFWFSHQLDHPWPEISRLDCLEPHSMPDGNSKPNITELCSQEAYTVFWSTLLFFLNSQVYELPGKILGAIPSACWYFLSKHENRTNWRLRQTEGGYIAERQISSNTQSSSLISNRTFHCPSTDSQSCHLPPLFRGPQNLSSSVSEKTSKFLQPILWTNGYSRSQ